MNSKREQYPNLLLGHYYLDIYSVGFSDLLKQPPSVIKNALEEMNKFASDKQLEKLIAKYEKGLKPFVKVLYLRDYYRLEIKGSITLLNEIRITCLKCYRVKPKFEQEKEKKYHMNFVRGEIEKDI